MNKLILIGNLGKDPEMRYTSSGQAVTSFSVASNRRFTDVSGQQREETEWFNVQTWNKLAEICNQHLVKGQQVYVEGRLKLRTYVKRDGQVGASLEVNADQVHFLGSKPNNSSSQSENGDAPAQDEAVAAASAAGHQVE